MKFEEKKQWKQDMYKDVLEMAKNYVWDLVYLPKWKNVIDTNGFSILRKGTQAQYWGSETV